MDFTINGLKWKISNVESNCDLLRRSDGTLTVGVTDARTQTVYLSNNLYGSFKRKVLAHELCHCFMISYDINIPIEQEEFLADWISIYGTDLIYLLDDLVSSCLQNVS